jgi:hypothetical protein
MGSAAGSGMPAGGAATGLAGWGGRYLRSVVAADATAALVAGVIALEVRFGGRPPTASYLWFTFGLPAVWVTCVALAGGYEPRLVGEGADEFRRVINAGVSLTAAIAIVSYLMKAGLSRGYVFVAMPTALVLDLTARYWLRKRLHRVRAGGGCMRRAVAVGHRRDVAGLIRMLRALSRLVRRRRLPGRAAGRDAGRRGPRVRRPGRHRRCRPGYGRRYGGHPRLPRGERDAA